MKWLVKKFHYVQLYSNVPPENDQESIYQYDSLNYNADEHDSGPPILGYWGTKGVRSSFRERTLCQLPDLGFNQTLLVSVCWPTG